MRTREQNQRMQTLLSTLESRPDYLGPIRIHNERVGTTYTCTASRPVYFSAAIMNENVMELAHRLAVESDPKRYSFRIPIFGATVTWKKAIEKEYYGLEDYEVEILGDRRLTEPPKKLQSFHYEYRTKNDEPNTVAQQAIILDIKTRWFDNMIPKVVEMIDYTTEEEWTIPHISTIKDEMFTVKVDDQPIFLDSNRDVAVERRSDYAVV